MGNGRRWVMNQRVEALISAASLLTTEEQLAVVERILSVVQPTNVDVDAEWIDEAEDRMAAYDRGEVETFDADAVLEELRSRSRTKA